ncbi:MAG: hypothetical protein IJW48_02290 [Clostridia bacterium]|nr:hypothetical protein [Clostridia bacterium]
MNQLADEQLQSFWDKSVYGYSLGQRYRLDERKSDFGRSGAAGSYYAIDRKNGMTFFVTHVVGYPEFSIAREKILPIIQEIIG